MLCAALSETSEKSPLIGRLSAVQIRAWAWVEGYCQAHALSCTALCLPMRWLVPLSKLSTIQLRLHPYWESVNLTVMLLLILKLLVYRRFRRQESTDSSQKSKTSRENWNSIREKHCPLTSSLVNQERWVDRCKFFACDWSFSTSPEIGANRILRNQKIIKKYLISKVLDSVN